MKGDTMPRRKGFLEIPWVINDIMYWWVTWTKSRCCGTQDFPCLGCWGIIGNKCKIGSSVKGMTRYGVKLCHRLTKWKKLEIMGIWNLDSQGLWMMSMWTKGWMPQPRVTWVALPRKRRPFKDDDEKYMYMLETKDLYNYQRNKESFGFNI